MHGEGVKSTFIRVSWLLCYLWTLEHFQVCSVPASHACRIYFILCFLQLWFPKFDSMTLSGFILRPGFTLILIAILHDLVFILPKLRWYHHEFPILQDGAGEIVQQLFTLWHGKRLKYLTLQLCLQYSFCQHWCLSCGCYSHSQWMQPWQEFFSPTTCWSSDLTMWLFFTCWCILFFLSVTSLSTIGYVMPWFSWSCFQFMLINFIFLSHFSFSVNKNPQLKMCVF